MTIDQVGEIGERLLKEYEGRLKVQGIKKFDLVLTTRIAERVECHLESTQPDQIEAVIRSVLNDLESRGDFVMSEPQFKNPVLCAETKNVDRNDLRLSFAYGSDIQSLKTYLWIACWIYPFNR